MFKGLPITRMERITAGAMSPTLEGGYVEIEFNGFAWKCDHCGLVWTRQHQAIGCGERGHVAKFESQLYGVTHVENGQPKGNPHTYTRHAIRRERRREKEAA